MSKRKTYLEALSRGGEYHTHIEASAENGVAQFRIVERLSEYTEASAETVRMWADQFIKQGLTKAHLFMSTRGGDPMIATDIAIELKSKFGNDNVSITCGAVVASAGTRILAEFDDVKCYPNSQFMIHRPKMGTYGDENQIEANLKLLKNTTNDYRTAYAKKFNKEEADIEALFVKGDYWMDAAEAKKLGLVSELLPEKHLMKAEDVAVLAACGAPTIPPLDSARDDKQDKSKTDMNIDELRSLYGLDANATEADVKAAAKASQEKASKADQLEADATKNAKLRAEALVDTAIGAKKLDAKKRDAMVALATADYANAKEIIDGMESVPKLSAELKGGAAGGDEKRDDWSLDAWLEKDPEGLNAMAETDPEKFRKLNNL